MLTVTAEWKARKGKEAELEQVLKQMVVKVRKGEPKCLEYTLHRSQEDKGTFLFYERYEDEKAFESHKTTSHFRFLIDNTESLIAKPVNVSLYEGV